ncbi:MAG: pilus assembly protein CpaC [Rhizorhabdus sp.]|nr:pilus assembly protein CpaC [Rhizorhabdus sp.]
MKKILLTGALLLSLPLLGSASGWAGQTLYPKGKRTLSYGQPISRIEIDRDDVVTVTAPTSRSLVVTGVGPGTAMLSAYGARGVLLGQQTIEVVPRPSAASAALAADPRTRGVIATRSDDGVALRGNADSLDARSDAQRFAAGVGEGPVTNRIGVSSEQVVAVDVQFAAVSSSTLKALGFNFAKLSGDIQGAIVSPSSLGSFNSTSSGLSIEASAPIQSAFNLFLSGPNRGISAVLSALSSNGLSQLLAQPTLLVRSGEQASFLAGGEIPIPIPQGGANNTIAIQFKEFGVRLSVTPFVMSKDRIVLKIAPEVSELDYNNGVRLQGFTVPGLRRRSAETTVQLGSGQSFVIAGLTYENSSITKEKTPLMGDLPVIGAFFKRQQNAQERQELIIVATPRLVGPMNAGQIPSLPGSARLDPTIGQMIVGNDGVEQSIKQFGVVRR